MDESKWAYQTCNKCKCEQRFSYGVNDEIWALLPHPWTENSVLCIDCFLKELEMDNPDLKLGIEDFYHIAFIGNGNFGGTILDHDYGSKYKHILLKK